jgi:uncharacterized membrane protein YdjX (TVP38/TMEM64 family)
MPALHVSFTVLNVQHNRADTIYFYRRVDTENFVIYFVFTILTAGSSETLLTIYIKLYGVTTHNFFTAVRTSNLTCQVMPVHKLEEGSC